MNTAKLKGAIVAAETTQPKLAQKLGIATSSLSAKIQGHRQFTYDELVGIKEHLNLDSSQFMEIFFDSKVS